MPSIGSITKTIRFSLEDRERIERLIEEEGISWSRAVHKLMNEGTPEKGYQKTRQNTKSADKGTPQEKPQYRQDLMDRAVEKDIDKMCELSGISTHDFYRGICDMFNDGKIYCEGDKVKSKGEWKLDEFIEVCHEVNVYPQEMIDKIVKGLR